MRIDKKFLSTIYNIIHFTYTKELNKYLRQYHANPVYFCVVEDTNTDRIKLVSCRKCLDTIEWFLLCKPEDKHKEYQYLYEYMKAQNHV